ncbi:MAG: DUF5652 family protein [Candidatus Daviesbacteria bacterium]|nr:DUF5652 family protein [Candidatus Daviesbacteria bacterium]
MFDWNIANPNLSIFLLIVWEASWKGVALWKSAKRGDRLWFVAMFLINFFGLIPIFYLWRTKQLEDVLKDFQDFFKLRFKRK